ncbi:MAG: hypothetical protein IT317_23530 [Anaerolineales bacterium]|nr:hypothetical protein [Anaerolineales bacterium]
MTGIGTLREMALHAGLKAYYARPGDALEAKLDGFVIDILRGEQIIEIQTHNFAAIGRKLRKLTDKHPVRLIHPVAVERWIVRLAPDGRKVTSRRKSPRRGHVLQVFSELVSFPELLGHPNFTLEVALVREEEVRQTDNTVRRRWRRDWRVTDRRLLEVVNTLTLTSPGDCAQFRPAGLTQPFTTSDLARALRQPLWLAQKMAYCLRGMGALEAVGQRGRAITYVWP